MSWISNISANESEVESANSDKQYLFRAELLPSQIGGTDFTLVYLSWFMNYERCI